MNTIGSEFIRQAIPEHLIQRLNQLYQDVPEDKLIKASGIISGYHEQTNLLSKVLPSQESFVKLQDELFKCLLEKIHLTPDLNSLHGLTPKTHDFTNLKLLIARAGISRQQAIHRDSYNPNIYVVAIYLSNNISTEVSNFPYESIENILKHEQTPPKYWKLPWSESPKDFIHYETKPGDCMIFKGDVLHRGIKNMQLEDRFVLFGTIVPKGYIHHDENQILEHVWSSHLYGFNSPQHLASLLRNEHHLPLLHYNKKQRKTLQASLDKFKAGYQPVRPHNWLVRLGKKHKKTTKAK